jgi:hypothetical protein
MTCARSAAPASPIEVRFAPVMSRVMSIEVRFTPLQAGADRAKTHFDPSGATADRGKAHFHRSQSPTNCPSSECSNACGHSRCVDRLPERVAI